MKVMCQELAVQAALDWENDLKDNQETELEKHPRHENMKNVRTCAMAVRRTRRCSESIAPSRPPNMRT